MSNNNTSQGPVLRCINCGTGIHADGLVWQVRRYDWELHDYVYCPCCSNNCALVTQAKDTTHLEGILDMLRNQSFQIMSPQNFLDPFHRGTREKST